MPTSVRDEFIEINGLNFHYRDWGGTGQPVVLLHGLASTSHIWDLVAPLLSQHFRVVALDQRGHGETDKPDSGYDFATVTQDLHGFIDNLGFDKPIVTGHSWGGDVALEYAVSNSEVPGGLGFVDGGMIEISSRPGMTLEQARVDMAPPLWAGVTLDQFRERLRNRWLGNDAGSRIEDIVLANFEVQEDGTIQSRLSRDNHLRIIEALWEHKPSRIYQNVRCPVLVMPARQKDSEAMADRRFRREESVARAGELIPRNKVVWFEDSIHDVPIQRPELVANTITEHIRNGFFD
jgi:pimeloyl-ACP methyl ester carboxylesterase